MNHEIRTPTPILADAMDVLARDIESGDGCANAAIAEAAQRLRELDARIEIVRFQREELAMMIRMLTSSLKRHWPHAPQPGDLPSRAISLLQRRGLMGHRRAR